MNVEGDRGEIPEAMTTPRFNLKTLLGCTVLISLPLAMAAAGQELGFVFLFPTAGGCVGYLLAGRSNAVDGAIWGAFVGLLVLFAIIMSLGPV
jgi:hypothetical protein